MSTRFTFLSVLALLGFTLTAYGTDIPVTCSNNGPADRLAIQSAVTGANAGDTITITGTCGVFDQVVTIGVGGSTLNPIGKALTIQGTATIQIGAPTTGRAFTVWTEGDKAFRMTGLIFAADPTVRQPTDGGVISLRGNGYNCRLDHNTFIGAVQHIVEVRNAAMCLIDNNVDYLAAIGDTRIELTYDSYPVGGLINPRDRNVNGGHGSFASELLLGSSSATSSGVAYYGDALYIESNTFFNCSSIASNECVSGTAYPVRTVTDGESGARVIVRYNTLHNLNIVMHGTEGGLNRGTAKVEIYRNTLYSYSTSVSRAIHLRSGNGVIFDNSVVRKSSGSLAFTSVFTHYRDNQGKSAPPSTLTDLQWGKCAGWGRYDLNSLQDVYIGTHTGPNDTSVLEDLNANGGLGWADDELIAGNNRYGLKNTNPLSPWFGYEAFIYANRKVNGANKVFTLGDHSVSPADGKCNLASGNFANGTDSQTCFKTGDTYAIRRVYKCIDQAGWHPGAGTSTLVSANRINQPFDWQGNRTPFYGWNNAINGVVTVLENDKTNRDTTAGSPPQTVTIHIPNEDYYNEAGPNNPHCPSSFNGTCGVGLGPVASLPATCTTGVAYWATDVGEWWADHVGADGALYKCTSTDTWTLYYTPFPYPHPLALQTITEFPTSYRIPANGVVLFGTTGMSDTRITVSHGRIEQNTAAALMGLAILEVRRNGVLQTQTAVPAVTPILSGRMFVEFKEAINTGIAISNPNANDAVISFYFTDASGANLGAGSLTLPPNQQLAAFLNQPPFSGPNNMQGTFTFVSSAPIGTIGVRSLTNERSEVLISPLPVTSLDSAPKADTLPYFVDGGGWTTNVVLINPSNTEISGAVRFFGQGSTQDAPLLEILVNGSAGSTFEYSIPPRAAVSLITAGMNPEAQIGSVNITPTRTQFATNLPVGLAILSFRNAGVTVNEASVPASSVGTSFRLYMEVAGSAGVAGATQSGIALANPTPLATTASVALTTPDGTLVNLPAATISVPAFGQKIAFINELFPGLTAFQGIAKLTAASNLAVSGLRGQYNERGDFLVATTPALNEAEDPSAGLVFPHVISGLGYSSKLIIFGAEGSGTFYLFSQDGILRSGVALTRR